MEWSDKTTPVDQGRATWWRKWDHDCNRLVIVYLVIRKWGAISKSFRIPSQSLGEFVDTWSLILRKWCSLKSSMSQWCSIYFLFNVCPEKVMWMVGFDKNSGDRDSGPSERWHVRTTRVRFKKWIEQKVVQRWYVAHCTGILIFTTYSYIWWIYACVTQNVYPLSCKVSCASVFFTLIRFWLLWRHWLKVILGSFFCRGMRRQKFSPTKWCRHVDFDHSLCGSFLDLNFSLGVDGCFCQQCHVAEGLPHGGTHAPAFRVSGHEMERAGTWNWKKKWHGNDPFLWWFSGRDLLRSFEYGWIWLGSTPQ